MNRIFLIMFLVLALAAESEAARVKDIARIQGSRKNQLIGYGVVVGLAGTGDSIAAKLTLQTVANFVNRFGINMSSLTDIKANNSAVVIVTADLPGFVRNGTQLDVNVASMADAKTLQGGVLMQTPLIGADGQVYAVAQGALALGGFFGGTSGAGGASIQKNHPTVGQIPNGALVEREIPSELVSYDSMLDISLREPDFTTAERMAEAFNRNLSVVAMATDSGTVRIQVPPEYMDASKRVRFISQVEAVEMEPDTVTRVVVNERTGTIVANAKVRISSVAVAHGNLTVSIASSEQVSQPSPFSNTGTTEKTLSTTTDVREDQARLMVVKDLPTAESVAAALNRLGATPRDMITIFEAIKQAGALQAELVIH